MRKLTAIEPHTSRVKPRSARLRTNPPTLREWVETLTGVTTGGFQPARQILLVPENLRFEWDEAFGVLEWDSVTPVPRTDESTSNCLWDFVALGVRLFGELDSPRSANILPVVESAIRSFIEEWGVLTTGRDNDPWDFHRGGYEETGEWMRLALEVSALIRTLVATEQGNLIDEDVLWDLREGDTDPPPLVRKEWIDERISLEDARRRRDVEWRESYRAIRANGGGIALQQRLLATCVNNWMARPWLLAVWDEKGRRIETEALGAMDIIGHELLSIFASAEPGIDICSVCDRPFSIASSGSQRRPRRGARRFCSEACRIEGKRMANRASWHRNKHRWSG